MSLFPFLHFEFSILHWLAALAAGLTVAVLIPRIPWPRRGPGGRLVAYTSGDGADADAPVPIIIDVHIEPETIILASLNLPPDPRWLTAIRLAAGAAPALLLLLLGYPLIPALGAGGLGAIIAHTWLQGRWRRFCNEVEAALPTFASRLSGSLLVSSAPIAALEETIEGLEPNAPLRQWMTAFLQGLRRPGRAGFGAQAQRSAERISPSLALMVFEIGRLLETGGAGFTQAFTATAEHLTSILKVRAVARAKAEAARTAVLTMIGIMGFILLLMLSSPQTRRGYDDPTVQIIAAVSLVVMAFGYLLRNNMIDVALEA
jgi:hypothetical protein